MLRSAPSPSDHRRNGVVGLRVVLTALAIPVVVGGFGCLHGEREGHRPRVGIAWRVGPAPSSCRTEPGLGLRGGSPEAQAPVAIGRPNRSGIDGGLEGGVLGAVA